MGVYIYSGVAYGFKFIHSGDIEELEEELLEIDPEKFFTVTYVGDEEVVVGINFGSHMSGEAHKYTEFDAPSEGTIILLERVKEKMDCMSDIKFHFFFFYE